MKIAILIRKYKRNAGGAERYCVELTEKLASYHEVHVFTQKHDSACKNIQFHKTDCCDFEKIKNLMKGVNIVYHCAATAHEGLSVFSPFEITKNNQNSLFRNP